MPEALTFLDVLEKLRDLHIAFPSHVGMRSNAEGTAKVYARALHGISRAALDASTNIIIAGDSRFPPAARIREVAWEWTRRNSTDVEQQVNDALWCPRCRCSISWVKHWRPRVDDEHFAILSDDGKFVFLETVDRLLCECAVPSRYKPEPEFDTPVMRCDRITWHFARRRESVSVIDRVRRISATAKLLTAAGDIAGARIEETTNVARDFADHP